MQKNKGNQLYFDWLTKRDSQKANQTQPLRTNSRLIVIVESITFIDVAFLE